MLSNCGAGGVPMRTFIEDQVGSDRFCIKPHVGGLSGFVFRLVPEEGSHSSLRLEVCEGVTAEGFIEPSGEARQE